MILGLRNFNYFFSTQLIEHDNELDTFKGQLFEVPKSFPPSYPFTEDLDSKYMKTRCPSWCDRILFNKRAQEVINLNVSSRLLDRIQHSTNSNEFLSRTKVQT